MYKLIVVDDKRDLTEGIIQMGKWSEIGFEVAGKAYNGMDAFELIQKVIPDVVITDIRMPMMDGIELTSLIKQHYPQTKVIILSGYDDFTYAQQAVKLGAEEYLLKPARIDMIQEAVLRAKEKLEIEKKKKEEQVLLQQKLLQSLPLLKDEYFRYLVSSPVELSLEEVKKRFDFLEIALDIHHFVVLIIELDNFRELAEHNNIKEVELYKFGVANIAHELVSQEFKCEVLRYQQNRLVILANYLSVVPINENKAKLFEISEKIRTSIEQYLDITVTVAIGGLYPNINDVYFSFKDAEEALAHKLYLGNNCVITADDVNVKKEVMFRYPVHLENELISVIKVGAVDQIDQYLEQYLNGVLHQKHMSPDFFRKIVRELIVMLSRMALELDEEENEKVGQPIDYIGEFEKYKTVDEIKQWLKEVLTGIAQTVHNQRKSQLERDIVKAKEYILSHYNEQITLQKVAEYVCISPTYFSAVFKEMVGETFIEFLIGVRIEKAKELLLAGQYKVYEVANMVGYSDRRYFSEVFKKHTGINPGEYVTMMKNRQS